MDYHVNVKFTMEIIQDGEKRVISFSSPGIQRLEAYDDALYMTLTYDEPVMDSEHVIQVKISLSPEKITIIRQGQTKSLQTYSLNERTQSHIVTEYGKIAYEAFTHYLYYEDQRIDLKYDLLFDGMVQGQFKMNVRIERQKGVER